MKSSIDLLSKLKLTKQTANNLLDASQDDQTLSNIQKFIDQLIRDMILISSDKTDPLDTEENLIIALCQIYLEEPGKINDELIIKINYIDELLISNYGETCWEIAVLTSLRAGIEFVKDGIEPALRGLITKHVNALGSVLSGVGSLSTINDETFNDRLSKYINSSITFGYFIQKVKIQLPDFEIEKRIKNFNKYQSYKENYGSNLTGVPKNMIDYVCTLPHALKNLKDEGPYENNITTTEALKIGFNTFEILIGSDLMRAKVSDPVHVNQIKECIDLIVKNSYVDNDKKREQKQYNVLFFLDKFLHKIASNNFNKDFNGKEDIGLTDSQQSQQIVIIDSIELAQKSVQVYVLGGYQHLLTPEKMKRFTGIQSPDFAKYFNVKENEVFTSHKDIKILAKKGYFSPKSNGTDFAKQRQYSKFQVIFSEVPYYQSNGSIKMIPIITARGINLSGLSPYDLDRYTFLNPQSNQRILNKELFTKDIHKIAHLILFAAKENKLGLNENNMFKIAEFNCGNNLQALTTNDQIAARKLIRLAFRHAAEYYGIYINWCIWDKNGKERDVAIQNADDINATVFYKSKYIKAIPGELGSDSQLNSGSDISIGGLFDLKNPITTEGQLAQSSFLILIQSNINPYFDANLNAFKVCSLPHDMSYVYIGYGGYVQIQFDLQNEAESFSDHLFKLAPEIFCDFKTKKRKQIYHKGMSSNQVEPPFFLRFDRNQYDEFMKLVCNKKVIISKTLPENYNNMCLKAIENQILSVKKELFSDFPSDFDEDIKNNLIKFIDRLLNDLNTDNYEQGLIYFSINYSNFLNSKKNINNAFLNLLNEYYEEQKKCLNDKKLIILTNILNRIDAFLDNVIFLKRFKNEFGILKASDGNSSDNNSSSNLLDSDTPNLDSQEVYLQESSDDSYESDQTDSKSNSDLPEMVNLDDDSDSIERDWAVITKRSYFTLFANTPTNTPTNTPISQLRLGANLSSSNSNSSSYINNTIQSQAYSRNGTLKN